MLKEAGMDDIFILETVPDNESIINIMFISRCIICQKVYIYFIKQGHFIKILL